MQNFLNANDYNEIAGELNYDSNSEEDDGTENGEKNKNFFSKMLK